LEKVLAVQEAVAEVDQANYLEVTALQGLVGLGSIMVVAVVEQEIVAHTNLVALEQSELFGLELLDLSHQLVQVICNETLYSS
jgi:hypothetical protein